MKICGSLRHVVTLAAAAVFVFAFTTTARAQGSSETRQQVAEALLSLKAAKTEVERIKDRVRAELVEEDEWKDVKKDLNKAQTKHDAARKRVLAKIRESREYVKVKADKTKAEEQLNALEGDLKADPEDITKAATAVAEA